MNDWRGVPVEVGDLVVYPGRQGSNVWINESEVVEILDGGKTWDGRDKHMLRVKRMREYHYGTRVVDPKIVTLHRADQVTVVEKADERPDRTVPAHSD